MDLREKTTAQFDAPVDSAILFPGKVMHARLKPFGNRFTYSVFTCLLDLDRLDEAAGKTRIFSVNRANLISFHESDHLQKEETVRLRDYASALVEKNGSERPARILLLAYPRILGFVFNPISVYFCYDSEGTLTATIYEVRNTFGERHSYVCHVENGQLTSAGLRQEREKVFYVSPFIEMGMRYNFRIFPPTQDTVKIRIFETEGPDPVLSATFSGRSEQFNTYNLITQLLRLPFMTLKVVAGIHWEALKLWIKGAKFHSRGKPPSPVSYQDTAAGPVE